MSGSRDIYEKIKILEEEIKAEWYKEYKYDFKRMAKIEELNFEISSLYAAATLPAPKAKLTPLSFFKVESGLSLDLATCAVNHRH